MKTIFHNPAKTALKLFATSASTLFLASLASLLAPTSANAASLIRENGTEGAVTRIEGLEDSQGNWWNVDFVYGTYETTFDQGSQFTSAEREKALDLAQQVGSLLGQSEYLYIHPTFGRADNFWIPFGEARMFRNSLNLDAVGDQYWMRDRDPIGRFGIGMSPNGKGLWAKFSVAEAVSTPEPSLILGFITLGGLMLGSKRKAKG